MKTGCRISGVSGVAGRFRRHPELLGRTMESVMMQEARALCVEYGAKSSPYGWDEGKMEQFRRRIDGDVSRVFAVAVRPNQVYAMLQARAPDLARAYWRAFKQEDEALMAKILRKANLPKGLDAPAHKAARTGKKGRVVQKVPVRLVTDGQLRRFQRQQRGLAGLAKAGWYCAAKGLGGRVRRNRREVQGDGTVKRSTGEQFTKTIRALARRFPDAGGARVLVSGATVTVEIWTSVRHAGEALSPADYAAATAEGEAKFAAAMVHAVREVNRRVFGRRAG